MRKVRFVLSLLVALVTAALAEAQSAERRFMAHLDGDQEVPVRDTDAVGQALFTLNSNQTVLTYKIIVGNIDNIVAGHLHLAPVGVNGAVVAFLLAPFAPGQGQFAGIVGEGTVTAANLTGPLAGHPLSDLITAIDIGNVYVNVHTNDGVDGPNTGPGDFASGEVRGQVKPRGK